MDNKTKRKMGLKKFFIGDGSNLKGALKDPSAISLLLANLVLLVVGLVEGWDYKIFLWTYFAQNVILGIFTIFKIFIFGIASGVEKIKIGADALAFIVSYSLFDSLFIYVLIMFNHGAMISWQEIYIGVIIFFANHLFSFIYNFRKDIKRPSDTLEEVFFSPYQRVLSMAIMTIAGGLVFWAGFSYLPVLIIFVTLKTTIDIKMHQEQHAQDIENLPITQTKSSDYSMFNGKSEPAEDTFFSDVFQEKASDSVMEKVMKRTAKGLNWGLSRIMNKMMKVTKFKE